MPRVQRLLFIGQHCPPLRVDAYRDALQTVVHATRHVALYLDTHARLNAALAAAGMLEVPADAAWVAATADAVRHTSERLETALRQSRSNLLKEQIRLAQLALGDHAWQCGELQTAAKCYARSRDYGSTNQHVLERGLREMALALETRNLHLMNTTLATLQALLPASGTMTTAPTALDVGVYVRACRAVMDLHDQRYADVARGLLKLPFPGVHHAAAVLLPHEILWQTVLCGLATLSRAELKALLIEFAPYLDLDGRARDAVQALLDGAYDVLFAALASAEPDCLLDMRLHRAVPTLVAAVRQRALVQYTRPFVSLRLDAMAAKLGLPVDDLERDVCALIAQGLIPMVVDSYAGVLYAKPADQRSRVLQKTLDQADDYVQTVHTMLLRMSLGQSGLAVQSSRDHDVW
ncbi:hypothetical protein CXG81DRAFT_9144 [Caulochytrium protostelioides]|uniref:PCI domain-containing protein n=1 Tax=Caulochytrium protostelioides TaxID=1555241 RepID=A0A4P9XE53_9FUNG|nr:hypothetical protein CXG81DRAFT_9144 [Caulochytrium protostelioides]|eukprot:RKP03793.1 hypothetical protein CXG81DRAFT_9144 [Caulochytrium protostelioides]